MARGRQGGNVKNSIKLAVYGEQGTRKSNTVADFAKMFNEDGSPMKVLYLDPENGSIDGYGLDRLSEEGVDVDNIYIIYTSEYKELEEFCDRAISGKFFYEIEEVVDEDTGEVEYIEAYGEEDKMIRDADGNPFVPDAIVIDGITVIADEVSDSAMALSEKRASIRADKNGKTGSEKEVMVGTAGLEFKDFSKIKSRGKKLIYKLLKTTNKHVGITLRAKPEKVMIKDDKNNMVLTATGKEIPETWAFILYDVYTVIHNKLDKDGNVFGVVENKDRSGMFAPNSILKGDQLSVASWQPVIEKNKSRRVNVATSAKSYEKVQQANADAYKEIETGDVVIETPKVKTTLKPIEKEAEVKGAIPTTLKELVVACTAIRKSLNKSQLSEMKAKLEQAGLPLKWLKDTPIEDMKSVYELLNS